MWAEGATLQGENKPLCWTWTIVARWRSCLEVLTENIHTMLSSRQKNKQTNKKGEISGYVQKEQTTKQGIAMSLSLTWPHLRCAVSHLWRGCARTGKGSRMASACSITLWAGTPQPGEQITGGGYDRYDKGHWITDRLRDEGDWIFANYF